jgi:hypothetical protein
MSITGLRSQMSCKISTVWNADCHNIFQVGLKTQRSGKTERGLWFFLVFNPLQERVEIQIKTRFFSFADRRTVTELYTAAIFSWTFRVTGHWNRETILRYDIARWISIFFYHFIRIYDEIGSQLFDSFHARLCSILSWFAQLTLIFLFSLTFQPSDEM